MSTYPEVPWIDIPVRLHHTYGFLEYSLLVFASLLPGNTSARDKLYESPPVSFPLISSRSVREGQRFLVSNMGCKELHYSSKMLLQWLSITCNMPHKNSSQVNGYVSRCRQSLAVFNLEDALCVKINTGNKRQTHYSSEMNNVSVLCV